MKNYKIISSNFFNLKKPLQNLVTINSMRNEKNTFMSTTVGGVSMWKWKIELYRKVIQKVARSACVQMLV